MVARLDWSTASAGARVVPAVLIAGFPFLIVPPGTNITSVAWTDGADAAWFVGSSPSVKGWLANGHDGTPFVIEERASPVQGTLKVRVPPLELLNVEGEVFRLLATRTTPFAKLAADLSATATTIVTDIPSASGFFGSSGVVHLGRERIEFAGTSGASLTGCTRGTAGTAAIAYRAQSNHRIFAQPAGVHVLPSVINRRVTLWALLVSESGAVVNPTLLADCRGAIGGGPGESGQEWVLPIKHVIEVLAEKADTPALNVSGIMHRGRNFRGTGIVGENVPDFNVLCATWQAPSGGSGVTMCLEDGQAQPSVDAGWHPTRESFLDAWHATAAGLSTTLNAHDHGRVFGVFAQHGTDRRLVVRFGWEGRTVASPEEPDEGATTTAVYSSTPFPEACMWLFGAVPFSPLDVAQVPPVPGTLSEGVRAFWTLRTKRDNGFLPAREITSKITAVGTDTLTLEAMDARENSHAVVLITKPTATRLGLYAEGPRWWHVLRYGVLAQLADARGLDHLQDAFAWDHLEDVAARSPGIGSSTRRYDLDITEPLADLFENEARLCGGSLVTHHGRVSMETFYEQAVTAVVATTLTTTDFRGGERPTLSECRDDLATSFKLTLPDGDTVRVVDVASVKESGEGEEIEAHAPPGALGDQLDPRVVSSILNTATNVLGPWSRPYDVAELPLTLRHVGLEIGDVLGVREWALPNRTGSQGLHAADDATLAATCTVFGRRIDLTNGTVDLSVRIAGGAYGYAPEALVSSIAGAVLTLDTVTVGAHGFGTTYRPDNTLRTDGGADTFEAGFKVQLVEFDASSPGTPFDAEVVSVSGSTVTLDAAPGGTWETRAAAGRCLLVFARWDVIVADQKRWAYVADDATGQFSDGTFGRRYAPP